MHNKQKVKIRYAVFPAKSEEDGRNWVVRDTKGAAKPGEGRIIKAFRGLANALNFAIEKNFATEKNKP